MHNIYSLPPQAASADTSAPTSRHHEPILSPAACRAVVDQEADTAGRIQSLVSFLNSDDQGVLWPEPARLALLARCTAFTDCSYLEDRWPGVGTGTLRYPANEPPPKLSPRHQQLARQRAAAADELAAEIGKVPRSFLKQLCLPLASRLAELQDLIIQLMTDCQPNICAKLESVLGAIERRPPPVDGAGCRISSDVQRILAFGSDPLGPTITAVNQLLALGCGTGDGSFTQHTQPAYFAQWKQALRTMERADWAKLEKQLETLKQLRAGILPPPVPERPSWLEQASEPSMPAPPLPHRAHQPV